MSDLEPILIRSPINLPEKKVGRVSVKHSHLHGATPIVGFRSAILRNKKPVMVELTEPLRIHQLYDEKHGLWMTDLPEELFQIHEMLNEVRPAGHVLVGGLGLGIVAKALTLVCPDVKSITVVERDHDIVQLCYDGAAGAGHNGYAIVVDDIFKYLQTSQRTYDCYLLDCWQGTSEAVWWETVMPLQRLIRQRWGVRPKIHCWAEDIMRGQVEPVLRSEMRHWHYKRLPPCLGDREINRFFKRIGLPRWEQEFGRLIQVSPR